MSTFRTHKTSADRSAADRRRHRSKIEKAIRDGVHDIVSDESIIGQDGKKRIKIPVRGIKEYQFVYGNNSKRTGSSAGKDLHRGQTVGKGQQKQQAGQPDKAGNDPGQEFYEVEISLDELAAYLFDDLELPDLEKKRFKTTLSEKPQRKGFRTHGIRPRLDKKRSLRSKLRRKAIIDRTAEIEVDEGETSTAQEESEGFAFNERDLMYRHYAPKPKENSNAVIFFIMDTSGSMGREKKFLARSYFFLIYQFLRWRYESVEIIFLSHDTTSKECDEQQFFTKGSSGGTLISPALNHALEIIEKRFHPDSWNIYGFHCSDGDNWGSDTPKAIEATIRLKEICQLYSYCEITPEDSPSWAKDRTTEMMEAYTPLEDRKFKITHLADKLDVWPAFKRLFGGKLDV